MTVRGLAHQSKELLAAFDAIGESGSVALIKIDGARDRNVFSVVVSGATADEASFREDGDDLELLLTRAVEFHKAR